MPWRVLIASILVTPLLVVATSLPMARAEQHCQFVLGFHTLHQMIPDVVGDCVTDEFHNPVQGDTLQVTTNGLLVWRKADNWTAFTDGHRTWINGPLGLQMRLNAERFDWEEALEAQRWDGRVEVDFETGAVTAEGFNEFVDREQPHWAHDPIVAASIMLDPHRETREQLQQEGGRIEIGEERDEQNRPVVIVTLANLPDDSVNAVRFRLTFVHAADGLVRFVEGTWGQRCQPGRGHQDFRAELCV